MRSQIHQTDIRFPQCIIHLRSFARQRGMEKANNFGAVIRQGIHEPPLVGWHPDLAVNQDGGNVIVKPKPHQNFRMRRPTAVARAISGGECVVGQFGIGLGWSALISGSA